ncbi:MAG: type II secretion system F family protein [Candidatus Omnitrophota bacterium]
MPTFVYKAKKNPTEIVNGKIEAADYKNAIIKLRQMQIFPLSVEQQDSPAAKQAKAFFPFKKRVPLRDLSTFTRQLSNLLDSGISLLNALEILTQQTQNIILVQRLKDIKSDIRDGLSLSAALARHSDIFPPLYVNMIKSGETGGMLDEVLSRLADFAEADEETLSKVRTSLAYPALLVMVGGVTIFILLSFVAPRLVSMFTDMEQALPLPTLILIGISNFFAMFWWLAILAAAVLIFGLNKWVKTKEGKKISDRFRLNLPVVGSFIKTSEFARLNRTLATLIKNGVPMVEALEVLARTMNNEIIRQDMITVRKSIIDGFSLSSSMKQVGRFPPMMINMIGVGEESGSLEDALFKTANSYDREVDREIKVFTTLLEPTIIIILGGLVGFIVIAMLLPIFQINLMVR